ncbi:MAG: lipoprotein [Candidatus Contendobacter sp.]|nr:lipoprotein [Candidatus Contendobacter sp.]MDS4059328.1 lipoprotein [Candidatus Contendobacter sp.]
MQRFCPRLLPAWLALAALLVGCGQKGPLYLPKSSAPPTASEQPPPASPSAQPATAEQPSPANP